VAATAAVHPSDVDDCQSQQSPQGVN